jgi:hypothetical protein
MDSAEASKRMPKLRRVGGNCPCSRAVRWVVDEPRPAAVLTIPPA